MCTLGYTTIFRYEAFSVGVFELGALALPTPDTHCPLAATPAHQLALRRARMPTDRAVPASTHGDGDEV